MTARPITDLLREHRRGQTLDDLSTALHELVIAVEEQRKAGQLTITIDMRPAGNSDAFAVKIEHKLKPPKGEPGTAMFFVSPDNNLVRDDPRQATMELREVPAVVARSLA